MIKLELEIHDDVISALSKIKNLNDTGVELAIPEGSPLFDNIVNLKLLRKEVTRLQKVLHMTTTDENGLNLIEMTEEEENSDASVEFPSDEEVYTKHEEHRERQEPSPEPREQRKLNFTLPLGFLKNIKLPKFGGRGTYVKGGLILLVVVLGIAGIIYYISTLPKASINLTVSSDPLVRSIQIKVRDGSSTNPADKLLRGIKLSSSTTQTQSAPTTGEKIVGKKASGNVKIYNKTTEVKTFKKGTTVTYDDDNVKLNFLTDSDLEVPARTESSSSPGVMISGEAEVKAIAESVGDNYNIDSDKTLSVKGQKSADFTAITSSDMTDGISKKVNVVAPVDKTNLSSALLKTSMDQAQKDLQSKVGAGQKLIQGSIKTVLVTESYTANVNDETDSLQLTQTVTSEGLTYFETDLNKLLDSLMQDFVPKGFVLSSKERTTTVSVLGNSQNTVLSPTEADLQVTLKTYVVPDITEDKIKEDLAGKSVTEANKYLNSVNKVKTFAIQISPAIPFFGNIPRDVSKIDITLSRE